MFHQLGKEINQSFNEGKYGVCVDELHRDMLFQRERGQEFFIRCMHVPKAWWWCCNCKLALSKCCICLFCFLRMVLLFPCWHNKRYWWSSRWWRFFFHLCTFHSQRRKGGLSSASSQILKHSWISRYFNWVHVCIDNQINNTTSESYKYRSSVVLLSWHVVFVNELDTYRGKHIYIFSSICMVHCIYPWLVSLIWKVHCCIAMIYEISSNLNFF